jgi:hypothetical protein
MLPVVGGLSDIQPLPNIVSDIVIRIPHPNSFVVIIPGHTNHTLARRFTEQPALVIAF